MPAVLKESSAMALAQRLLQEWLGPPTLRVDHAAKDNLAFEHDKRTFVVVYKAASDAASVRNAVEHTHALEHPDSCEVIPLVAVPHMGDVGKEICRSAQVSWFDLSGNAQIVIPGMRIIVSGNPNAFKRVGRPNSIFAPKSARIARRLLIEPDRVFKQQDLARLTGLDDGFTSRIVSRLLRDDLVARDGARGIRVKDPALLLDAWSEVYDFDRHEIIRGHVTARESQELQARIANALSRDNVRFAATGLGAAWQYNSFAAFRLVSFFVEHRPNDETLANMTFREEEKGANVWLVVPNDEGVFDGSKDENGLMCVHPVQLYLDLQSQPERAKEAAEELRRTLLAPDAQ